MKNHLHREAEPSVERSEFARLAAFRLNQRILRSHSQSYHVTVTPRGKNVSHYDLYQRFMPEINKYKCVKDVFLIAEFENTNHFHGIIYTKDKCKFLNMWKKTQLFQFDLSDLSLTEWIQYMLKRSPSEFYNIPLN